MSAKGYSKNQFMEAVRLLQNWQTSGGDNFGSLVYRMISKADPENKRRLRLGFPEYVDAWEEWHETEPESAFFEKYGVVNAKA